MSYFKFRQNNSFGVFRGTPLVFVQADNAADANDIAQDHGIVAVIVGILSTTTTHRISHPRMVMVVLSLSTAMAITTRTTQEKSGKFG